ncbi:putative transcription factor interactor and regulator CCHC(Zn) family [Helianthus anomalus]
MLAAGFLVNSTASNNNNAALISQSGFQKAASVSANVHYSGSTPPSTAPSTAASNSKENLDITASVINCLNTFAAGKLDPPKYSMDDLDQIHPDDSKELCEKNWKNKWDGLKFTGPGKIPFELRCYNCHEPGHVARNCSKPSISREQTPAQPAPPNPERSLATTTNMSTTTSGSTHSSALVVQPSANFDWNAEIQRLNISAPENQTALENIAFMTSASEDQNSAPDDEVQLKTWFL